MDWRTKLLDPTARARRDYQSLATPVYRGSTVVFDSARQVSDHWDQSEHGFSYGLYGTPTALELAARIAEIENAHRSFIVPGGQAAIALIYLAFCKSGDHALVPYSAYGPTDRYDSGLPTGKDRSHALRQPGGVNQTGICLLKEWRLRSTTLQVAMIRQFFLTLLHQIKIKD